MTTVRNLLSSIWPDSQRTAAVASSNATALPTSSRHPHYATYYDLLSTARHGTPLWLPEPNETQHINYRRQGAAIGDVVILTDNGGLHLLFNICLDADDPINGPNDVPEGFSPFKPALRVGDVTRFREYGEDSYLASKAITKERDLQGPAGLWFESSASEGAILAMPEGAYSEDLARKNGFDRYLEENLDSWYHYINDVREFGIEQGQLRLVTGVHKAKAWGIATFSNERAAAISDLKMEFKSNEDISSGALYSWEFKGNIDSSRSGPTRKQREDVFAGRLPLENQCLFVRTVNASSRKVGGKNRESHSISVPTSQIDIHSHGLEHSGSARPSNHPSSSSSSSSQGGRVVQNQMGAQYSLPIEQNGPVLRDHPSKAINDFLLEEKPSARIAITHDEDWMSLLTDDDVSLPSGNELVARLKKSCKITEHGGVVSLEFDTLAAISMEEVKAPLPKSFRTSGDHYNPSQLQLDPKAPSPPKLKNVYFDKASHSDIHSGNSDYIYIGSAGMAATANRLETLPTVQNTLKSIDNQGELGADIPISTPNATNVKIAGAGRSTDKIASFLANSTYSTNVKIAGGEFNVVHGNYSVFNHSRHTSNVGSFNTTNNTTVGSHNDNSQWHYGGCGRPPNPPRPDASRSNGTPSDAPYPNGQYFPPPAVHPALMGGANNLPPGSTISNFNPSNTMQTTVDKAYNDNSRGYSVPSSAPPRARNPNVGPQAGPFQQQYPSYAQSNDQNRHGNSSPTGSAYNQLERPNVSPGLGGQTLPRVGKYAQDPHTSYRYGGGLAYVSGDQIQYGQYGRGSRILSQHQRPSLQVEEDCDCDDASSSDDEDPRHLRKDRNGVANPSCQLACQVGPTDFTNRARIDF